MMCNYLNEGCDGGWSFFHGFLAENGYMVSEKCAPYKAKTKGDKCGNYEKCKPVARVKQSYFIGGAYGESSEKKMMKEILRNGIVNGSSTYQGSSPSIRRVFFRTTMRPRCLRTWSTVDLQSTISRCNK
jgi:hypothetical protein